MERQRGFSLIEVLVATAIASIVGWQLLILTHTTILEAAHLDERLRGRTAVDRLDEGLASDAATAWSVFVPPRDVNGMTDADGHELDFVTEDASHRSYWWAYTFDAAARRVTKYAYTRDGPPVAGEVYDGIEAFQARAHPITDLTKRANEAFDPLFADADVTPVDMPFGWNAAATGGNHFVRLAFAASGSDRVAILASGTAPSHFTVVVDYTPPPATSAP